jgi:hypothetical protein
MASLESRVLAVAAGLVAAGLAAAGDLQTPAEEVLFELRAALDGGDEARAEALLEEAGEIYRWPGSPEEAAALVGAAGEASRARSPRIAAAAVRALGRMEAPAAAAYVERFLRPGAEGGRVLVVAAIQAAGRIRAPVLVPALLRMAREEADLVLADQALLALGEYGTAEAEVRKGVADKTLDLCQVLSRHRERWDRLRAPGLRALQRLIGRRLNTVGQFTDWWRHARTLPDPFAGPG